jgi:hypothetical protein
LRRSPAFAAAAVLSLALGIGANTAIFSILDSLMLKSLPVSDPQRLARITATGERQNFTNPLWEQLRARPELAQGLAAFGTSPFNLAETGPADRVAGLWVSGRFFDVMGVRPLLGRVITEADDQRTGGPDGPVAVINERFWRAIQWGSRRVGPPPHARSRDLHDRRRHAGVVLWTDGRLAL